MTQRSVPSQEGDSLLGGSVFKNRTNAIQKCAQVAAKNEFKVFVLQVCIVSIFILPDMFHFSH